MGLFGKSKDQKWAEAKQKAHQDRAANGQRVTGRAKTYTAAQQIKDKNAVNKAKGWC